MKKLIKEPLFHFLVLGAFIFVLFGIINSDADSSEAIIIDDDDVNSLISKWESQWKRPPTEKELEDLLRNAVRQEIYYQEALKMNLDHNDEIIKRRLSQKLEFLSSDFASLKTIEDDELQVYFDENIETYRQPSSYSFYQIIFTSDNHQSPEEKANEILKNFPSASIEDMKAKGDSFAFNYEFNEINSNQLRIKFGTGFPEQMESLEIQKWVGPIRSGFGYHLIFISEKITSYIPKLDEVKEKVLTDFEYDYQETMIEDIYKGLKQNYTIQVNIKSEDFDPIYVNYLETELNN